MDRCLSIPQLTIEKFDLTVVLSGKIKLRPAKEQKSGKNCLENLAHVTEIDWVSFSSSMIKQIFLLSLHSCLQSANNLFRESINIS